MERRRGCSWPGTLLWELQWWGETHSLCPGSWCWGGVSTQSVTWVSSPMNDALAVSRQIYMAGYLDRLWEIDKAQGIVYSWIFGSLHWDPDGARCWKCEMALQRILIPVSQSEDPHWVWCPSSWWWPWHWDWQILSSNKVRVMRRDELTHRPWEIERAERDDVYATNIWGAQKTQIMPHLGWEHALACHNKAVSRIATLPVTRK